MHYWRITVHNHKVKAGLHRGHDPAIFDLINEFTFYGFEPPYMKSVVYKNIPNTTKFDVSFELSSKDPTMMAMTLLKMKSPTPFTVEEIEKFPDYLLTWD